MRTPSLLFLSLFLTVAVGGCAWYFHDYRMDMPEEQRDGLDVGCFIADLFLTGGVGLIVDFWTGCIWEQDAEYAGELSGDTPRLKEEAKRAGKEWLERRE